MRGNLWDIAMRAAKRRHIPNGLIYSLKRKWWYKREEVCSDTPFETKLGLTISSALTTFDAFAGNTDETARSRVPHN